MSALEDIRAEYAATLAPHPWDAVGKPPAFGLPYPGTVPSGWVPPEVMERALKAAEKLRRASEAEAEAAELEDEARGLEREADNVLASLRDEYGALVEAIRDDPYSVDNPDDVARIMADEATA